MIEMNSRILLVDNATFCMLTLTQSKQFMNVSLNIQQQLNKKQAMGEYVTHSDLSAAETELQAQITTSEAAIMTAYTAADVVVASSAAAALSAAYTSLQTQIALKQDKSPMSSYAT